MFWSQSGLHNPIIACSEAFEFIIVMCKLYDTKVACDHVVDNCLWRDRNQCVPREWEKLEGWRQRWKETQTQGLKKNREDCLVEVIFCIERRLQSETCHLPTKLAWLSKASFGRCVPWSNQCTRYMKSHLPQEAGSHWIKETKPNQAMYYFRWVFSTWSIIIRYEMLRLIGRPEFRELYIIFFLL